MKRIAILGCENSHANAFLKYVKENEEFFDVEVVGIYSDETEPCEKLAGSFGVRIMDSFDEAVGLVDGLVITARHGDNHYKYAKPYIESGIPMFIDKPITISEEEALKFMSELRDNGVRISGGSSLKYDRLVEKLKKEACEEIGGKTVGGFVCAPLQSQSEYGGFFFYAQHLVEMVCEIFGRYPNSVRATAIEDKISVLFNYSDYICTGTYSDTDKFYFASRLSESGMSGGYTGKRDNGNDYYYKEFSEFYGLLCGNGQKSSYEDFIAPVFIMNAIVRSLESNREEKIREYKI